MNKVYCNNCKYFNKRNLCSSGGKSRSGIIIYVNKFYMQIVAETGKCKDYIRKWYKFWVK